MATSRALSQAKALEGAAVTGIEAIRYATASTGRESFHPANWAGIVSHAATIPAQIAI
jgi:hypothetical protein